MEMCNSTLQSDSDAALQGIQFASSASRSLCAAPLQLCFLSIVDTSKIPLSFMAEPSQQVWTDDEATLMWFAERLSPGSSPSSSTHARLGILAEVQAGLGPSVKTPTFNEVLFFAATPNPEPCAIADNASFTLEAIPLFSQLPSYLPSPPLIPQDSPTDFDAQFLPPLDQLQSASLASQKKRKQVADVFDEATERRRKARRHGGESVAAAASLQTNSVNILVGQKKPKAVAKTQVPQPMKEHALPAPVSRPHSRAGSISALLHEQPRRMLSRSPSMSSGIGPVSRKGIAEPTSKRSTLSRVSSLADTASTEDRNKDAISRLVMAGMRLYGLQQRKKSGHSRRVSEAHAQLPGTVEGGAQDEAAKDEEYKLIYHQTYKGAVFAFRRVMTTELLHSDPAMLQDTVDKLLAIFCTDPLAPA